MSTVVAGKGNECLVASDQWSVANDGRQSTVLLIIDH